MSAEADKRAAGISTMQEVDCFGVDPDATVNVIERRAKAAASDKS